MPRDDVAHAAVVVPGAYVALQEQDCIECCRPDPRLYLTLSETPEQFAQWQVMKDDGRRKAAAMLELVLAAGEPITVPRWRLSRNTIPALRDADTPLLHDRSIEAFVVFADDRVAPADAPEVSWW